MSETKRGYPTDCGDYDLLLDNGEVVTRRISCGVEMLLNGQATGGGGILYAKHLTVAHRKHEPIKVPELKKVERKVVTPAVVAGGKPGFVVGGSVYLLGSPVQSPVTWYGYSDKIPHFTDKASCEAAGYAWPF